LTVTDVLAAGTLRGTTYSVTVRVTTKGKEGSVTLTVTEGGTDATQTFTVTESGSFTATFQVGACKQASATATAGGVTDTTAAVCPQ
jgi:hypothetical protein